MPTCPFRHDGREHTDSDLAFQTLESFRQLISIGGVPSAPEDADGVVLGHYEEGVGAFEELGSSGGGTCATIIARKIGVMPIIRGVACCGDEAAG